jgi:RNA polymerase sigma-70 factor (ECF subfamily)
MINVKFSSSFRGTFSKKLETHRSDLYKIAWSWCHNNELADDLVQETYAKALKNRSQLNDITKLKPWLTRILVNLHSDYYRSKQQQVEFEDEYALTEFDPSDLLSRDESVQIVRKAIAQLNDKHRKIISLVDIADFSYAEVADILEIPVGTVMSRLNRARGTLKSLLHELENNELVQNSGKEDSEKSPSSSNFLRRVK